METARDRLDSLRPLVEEGMREAERSRLDRRRLRGQAGPGPGSPRRAGGADSRPQGGHETW